MNYSTNIEAFFDVIAWAEIGDKLLAVSDNGYNVLVGSTWKKPRLFHSYDDHPRIYLPSMNSTAAGRFQINEPTYDDYAKRLKIKGFYPEIQRLIVFTIFERRKAVNDILNGELERACWKLRRVWASLPGAGYDQPEKSMAALKGIFLRQGGILL